MIVCIILCLFVSFASAQKNPISNLLGGILQTDLLPAQTSDVTKSGLLEGILQSDILAQKNGTKPGLLDGILKNGLLAPKNNTGNTISSLVDGILQNDLLAPESKNSTKPSLGGILQEGLSRPLTSLLSKNSPVFTLLQPSTLEDIVLKLLELLKPLLPFINILLQHVTEILIVVINNLGDFLDHLIAILNALLPDWKNILLQLVQTLLQLLNEILPQLRPLLKEVLKLVQGLLQFLFDGNLCDLDKVFDKVDQLLAI
eukprot:XP_011412806.1 PREDICTED: uncharacterized protein LOC105317776 isoform X1 [Crassostrea gigas]